MVNNQFYLFIFMAEMNMNYFSVQSCKRDLCFSGSYKCHLWKKLFGTGS